MSDQKNDDQQEFAPLYEEHPAHAPIDLGETVTELPPQGAEPHQDQFAGEPVDVGHPSSGDYVPEPQEYAQPVSSSRHDEFDQDLTDFSDIDDGVGEDDDEGIFAPPVAKKKKSSFGMMLVAVSAVAILGAGGYFYTTNPAIISQIKENLTGDLAGVASDVLPRYEMIGGEQETGQQGGANGDAMPPQMADMPPQPQPVTDDHMIVPPAESTPVSEPVSTEELSTVVIDGDNSMTLSGDLPDMTAASEPNLDDMALPDDVASDMPVDMTADEAVTVTPNVTTEVTPEVAPEVAPEVMPVVTGDVVTEVPPQVAPAEVAAADMIAPPPVVADTDVIAVPAEESVEVSMPTPDTPTVIEDAVVPPAGEAADVTTLVLPEPVAEAKNPDTLSIVDDVSGTPDPAALKQAETEQKAKDLEQQEQQIADTYFDAPPGDIMKKLPAPSMDVKRGASESIIVVTPKSPKAVPPKRAVSVPDSTVSIEATSLEPRIVAANRALKLGRLDSARSMYDELYAVNPRDPRILMGRAVLFQKSGDSARAISAYEEVLDVDPDNTDAIINLTGLVRQDYPAEALGKLLDLRQKYPENATIAAQLGVAYAGSGNFQDAYRYLSMAASMEPDNAQHYYNMAIVAERGHDVTKAIGLYEKALEVDAIHGSGRSVNRDVIYDRLTRLRGH